MVVVVFAYTEVIKWASIFMKILFSHFLRVFTIQSVRAPFNITTQTVDARTKQLGVIHVCNDNSK